MALDYEDQVIFVVVAPVDLNLLRRPELLAPSSYSDDKTLCCWCCAQGPISLDVDLPKRTLVPGETINVTARLTNMSNTNVEGVGFEMKQRIICLVNEPNKEEKEIDNILVDVNEVGLGAHGEHTYTFNVMLPMNVPIPNFSQCRLFKAEYVYKMGDFDVELLYLELLENEVQINGNIRKNIFEELDDGKFLERYRLSKKVVIKVLEEIEPALEYATDRNFPLTPIQQLLIALRFYATGSFQTVMGDDDFLELLELWIVPTYQYYHLEVIWVKYLETEKVTFQ
ncbi:uncharacterized protein LOC111691841 [Anoplophora glabripennis]|uniref:uncharacterized protein LOC111691841 n=1 Tax=Anoplophora glabripennis TaxID=217634 RepID=UPI000C7859C2|nr:uncharacterized protein LOC111691841 [Anoplophora glabripennis]